MLWKIAHEGAQAIMKYYEDHGGYGEHFKPDAPSVAV